MYTYIKAMVRYTVAMTGLSEGFKVIAVAGGVILGSMYGASTGVTTLLLVYGLVLGDRMNTIFNMNEVLSSSQVEAEALVEALDSAKSLGPELRAVSSVIRLQRVSVTYEKASEPVVVKFPPEIVIEPGITLIMGPSGQGKTTLLRILNGMPYKGSATFGDIEIAGRDPRQRLVYAQQSFEPLEAMRALDLFGGVVSEESTRALWCAGYPEAPLDREVAEYSGGQHKRLLFAAGFYKVLLRERSLAMALALDEPTNHLDAETAERLMRGIRWIADYDPGLAIPIVTHDPRLKNICDNIIDLGEM